MTRQRQISVLCFILFGLLSGCVWFGYTNSLDTQLHRLALGVFPAGSERIWEDITFFGSGLAVTALTVLAVVILGHQKKWDDVRYLVFVMAAAGATEVTMKLLIHRPRPAEVFANTLPNSFSFPSGHTIYGSTFYFAIAAICTPCLSRPTRKAVWLAALVLALLIGASRIFLGVHYFSDVVGGYLVSVFWISLFISHWPTKNLNR